VGQPSISQEIKNIPIQVKIQQITNSCDIPGTPILEKTSPLNQTDPITNISLSIQINLKKEDIDCQTESIKIKNVEVLECLTTQNNVDNNTQNRVDNNNTNDLIENLLIESQTSITSTSNCSSIKNENIIINKPTDITNPPVINKVKENVIINWINWIIMVTPLFTRRIKE